jgi:hypothetical protein
VYLVSYKRRQGDTVSYFPVSAPRHTSSWPCSLYDTHIADMTSSRSLSLAEAGKSFDYAMALKPQERDKLSSQEGAI